MGQEARRQVQRHSRWEERNIQMLQGWRSEDGQKGALEQIEETAPNIMLESCSFPLGLEEEHYRAGNKDKTYGRWALGRAQGSRKGQARR